MYVLQLQTDDNTCKGQCTRKYSWLEGGVLVGFFVALLFASIVLQNVAEKTPIGPFFTHLQPKVVDGCCTFLELT